MKDDPVEVIQKHYYEIAQGNTPGQFAALMKMVPISQVMFGSDYKGGIVLRPDRPWETTIVRRGSTVPSDVVEFYNPPVWDSDEKVYKMWYIIGDGAATGFARSRDGVHWEKPNLGVTEFRGSKENNLVSVRDQPKAMIVHVLRDPDDTADRRYKGMAFLGAAGRQLVVSRDGFDFRALPREPIPGQDTSHLIWDERARQYVLTVKHSGPFGRSVWLSTSKDFENWTPHELIFSADALDQELGRRRIRRISATPAFTIRMRSGRTSSVPRCIRCRYFPTNRSISGCRFSSRPPTGSALRSTIRTASTQSSWPPAGI